MMKSNMSRKAYMKLMWAMIFGSMFAQVLFSVHVISQNQGIAVSVVCLVACFGLYTMGRRVH